MAIGFLSPWPKSPVALKRAIFILARALRVQIDVDSEVDTGNLKAVGTRDTQQDQDIASRLAALGDTASSLVERYGSEAPQNIRDEATIRTAAFLQQTPSGIRKIGIGGADIEFTSTSGSALRASGAMALLSPWVVRRATGVE